jgi:type I restriction enzyme R subunit
MSRLDESQVELAALEWFQGLGYEVRHGQDIAPGEAFAERDSYEQVVLAGRLKGAVDRLNPHIPAEAREEAVRKVMRPDGPSLIANNHQFHRWLVEGIAVSFQGDDGTLKHDQLRLAELDPTQIDRNDWLVVNQFTVIEGKENRRPDVVVFLNGLPVAVLELKNAAGEDATVARAFHQLQTYKKVIPGLFVFNELLIASDGLQARLGSLTSNLERFMPWRTVDGEEVAPLARPQLDVVIRGVFEKARFLDYLRYFVVFEAEDSGLVKKLAGYHQFHAVRVAIESTVSASASSGNRRGGVVWHTQGSGKSLTMAFFAGRLALDPRLNNPTVVVLTDRNDLDDQLFATFSRCKELLRQTPMQAESRQALRSLLAVNSGGVVFTTIQKFMPEERGDRHPLLTDRRNVVVIADEAHRSQYDFIDGFARHLRDALPNASFIGFTGTPIELTDANTRAVFGDYVSIYDIQRAVEDKATVPIYYEGRLAKLELKESQRPRIDEEFEEVTEGEEEQRKEKLKTKWAALEALVGSETRLCLIAKDLVDHFEARLDAMDGKAMVVSMSRRICVELYREIVKLRPSWHSSDDDQGAIKIVMTGSASDPLDWQEHIRNKPRREQLAKRMRNPADPLKIVIVRDMWLTGFDVPCLHTMYVDKPMRGHGLMQAIARVNRVFRDKPGGLVVDYLGLADSLRKALANYTENGGVGRAKLDQEEAVAVMLEKHEICAGLFHTFDYSTWMTGTAGARLTLVGAALEHILDTKDGRERLLSAVQELSLAFALAVPHDEAIRIRDDVGFFQSVRAALAKSSSNGEKKTSGDLDHAIRQIVSRSVSSDEVIDIFSVAGLKKPDISVLSDEFLAEVAGLPQRNLAVELLQRLLSGEINARSQRNIVQSRSFASLLEQAVAKYKNRAIETAQVIEELIGLAKQVREAQKRGENLGLTDDEVAFYDALEVNDSAVKVLGDAALRMIARELVDTVRRNVTIDWTVKETVRAKLRVMVKRILKKYGYPPDLQEKATQTVLEQAEVLCHAWGF